MNFGTASGYPVPDTNHYCCEEVVEKFKFYMKVAVMFNEANSLRPRPNTKGRDQCCETEAKILALGPLLPQSLTSGNLNEQ